MFDKLKGMGDITKVITSAMSGNYGAVAEMLKPQLIEHMPKLIAAVVEAGGGDPATHGAWFWTETKADGRAAVMATIARRNELDEPGEAVGTFDVLQVLEGLDLAQFMGA